METSKVVTIPNYWTSPKYSLGQRTFQTSWRMIREESRIPAIVNSDLLRN